MYLYTDTYSLGTDTTGCSRQLCAPAGAVRTAAHRCLRVQRDRGVLTESSLGTRWVLTGFSQGTHMVLAGYSHGTVHRTEHARLYRMLVAIFVVRSGQCSCRPCLAGYPRGCAPCHCLRIYIYILI